MQAKRPFGTWTMEKYKALYVWSGDRVGGAGGGEGGNEEGSRARLEPCAPVSGAGKHSADLEFPLGDGLRCHILCG